MGTELTLVSLEAALLLLPQHKGQDTQSRLTGGQRLKREFMDFHKDEEPPRLVAGSVFSLK